MTDTVVASVRAVVQLAALAGVLAVVVEYLWASALFVLVMATAAAFTSARRIRRPDVRAIGWCVGPVAVPTLILVVVLVLVGVLPTAVSP